MCPALYQNVLPVPAAYTNPLQHGPDMSSPLILLSAKQKSAVNSQFCHYKMSRQKYSTVTIYLKTPTKLIQGPQQVQ
jgi:hypothetical protein